MTKVYGYYRTAEDQPETGAVSLTPYLTVPNDSGLTRLITEKKVVSRLDEDGYIELEVIPSDDPGWRTEGQESVPYLVEERLEGEIRDRLVFILGTSPVDINLLPNVPVDTEGPVETPVPGPPGEGTITVGDTTTGEPGTEAEVVNVGDTTNVVLDFTIPRGEPGSGAVPSTDPDNLLTLGTDGGMYGNDRAYTDAGDQASKDHADAQDDAHSTADRQYTDDGLATKSDVTHTHDADYAPIVHDHDDRYYTETETDGLLDTHAQEAKDYADTQDDAHSTADRGYTDTETAKRLRWRGYHTTDGFAYQTNDVVLDGDWTMVAIADTTDRPAPQPDGSPAYLYTGTSPEIQTTAKTLTFGQQFTNPTSPYYITGYRVYVVTGNAYNVFTVDADGVFDPLIEFTADTTGWVEFETSSPLIGAGTTFALLVQVREPDPSPTTFTANWNYQTPPSTAVPAAGAVNHPNESQDIMRFSKTDSDGGDQSALLLALSPGDTIDALGTSWAIQTVTDGGTYVQFVVAPALQASPDGIAAFTFTTETATPITLLGDPGYWLSNPDIKGLYSIDGAPWVETDDAYGVDLEIQGVLVSPDWEVMALSGGGGGGSSGGGGPHHHDTAYVNVEGDTMTGALTLPGDPVNPLEAASKQYVDNAPNQPHDHDDRYYTEAETDAQLAGKSDTTHNHDGDYSDPAHTHDDRYYTEAETDALVDQAVDEGIADHTAQPLADAVWYVDAGTLTEAGDGLADLSGGGRDAIFGADAAAPVVLPHDGEDYIAFQTIPSLEYAGARAPAFASAPTTVWEIDLDDSATPTDIYLLASQGYTHGGFRYRGNDAATVFYRGVSAGLTFTRPLRRHQLRLELRADGYIVQVDGVEQASGAWAATATGSGTAILGADGYSHRFDLFSATCSQDGGAPLWVLDPSQAADDYATIANTGTAGGAWEMLRPSSGYKHAVVDRPLLLFRNGDGNTASVMTATLPPNLGAGGYSIITAVREFGTNTRHAQWQLKDGGQLAVSHVYRSANTDDHYHYVWQPSTKGANYQNPGGAAQRVAVARLSADGDTIDTFMNGAPWTTTGFTGWNTVFSDGELTTVGLDSEVLAAVIFDRALTDKEVELASEALVSGRGPHPEYALRSELDGKSDSDHTHPQQEPLPHIHDDRYYTEAETDTLVAAKADVNHTHPPDGHDHDADYVNVTGDTMTGDLTLAGEPTDPSHAATKQYVDNNASGGGDHNLLTNLDSDDHSQYAPIHVLDAADPDPVTYLRSGLLVVRKGVAVNEGLEFLQKQGGTMTGPLLLQSDPTSAMEAAPKQYVDTYAKSLRAKLPNKSIPTGGAAGTALNGTLTVYQNDDDHYTYDSSTGKFTVAYGGMYIVSLRYWGSVTRTSSTTRHIITLYNLSGSILAREEVPYNDNGSGLSFLWSFTDTDGWYWDVYQNMGSASTASNLNVNATRVGPRTG